MKEDTNITLSKGLLEALGVVVESDHQDNLDPPNALHDKQSTPEATPAEAHLGAPSCTPEVSITPAESHLRALSFTPEASTTPVESHLRAPSCTPEASITPAESHPRAPSCTPEACTTPTESAENYFHEDMSVVQDQVIETESSLSTSMHLQNAFAHIYPDYHQPGTSESMSQTPSGHGPMRQLEKTEGLFQVIPRKKTCSSVLWPFVALCGISPCLPLYVRISI